MVEGRARPERCTGSCSGACEGRQCPGRVPTESRRVAPPPGTARRQRANFSGEETIHEATGWSTRPAMSEGSLIDDQRLSDRRSRHGVVAIPLRRIPPRTRWIESSSSAPSPVTATRSRSSSGVIRPGIYNIALRMLYHPQDAETRRRRFLVKALTALSSFEGRSSSFRTWLYRIAVNHVFNTKAGPA